MLNIKLEITDDDVREYLYNHKYDNSIRYKEALFIKYMKETGYRYFTYEMFEMLFNKINDEEFISNQDRNKLFTLSREKYIENFDSYLKKEKLNIEIFWHILIPILGFYKERYSDISLYDPKELSDFLPIPYSYTDDYEVYLYGTIDNYIFINKIKFENGTKPKVKDIMMDVDECREIIRAYSKIYGEKPVENMKKLVRKGN